MAVDDPQIHNDDEAMLAKLGYKQELNRSWSGFSNFAISFSIISILAGCFTSFGIGWNNGGPAAIAWGWPILTVFILIIGMCMSELVSAYPTSGGIYWWASKLGGPRAGFYTDSHPPAMAALWRLVEHVVRGPSGILVIQSATLIIGLAMILWRAFRPLAAAVTASALFLFPPICSPLAGSCTGAAQHTQLCTIGA